MTVFCKKVNPKMTVFCKKVNPKERKTYRDTQNYAASPQRPPPIYPTNLSEAGNNYPDKIF
jgi:hypothetical protein